MSGSEEKKLNSLHEEDSLYKAQGGKATYQISPTYGQNTLYKVNPVHDAWDRALAAESICQDILSSARNQLYLNMRFMDCALSALFFQGDMGVHPVGTDGTVLYYQPEELMEQFRRSQEKVNRIYLHSLLHCIFLHCFPEKDEEGNPAVDVQYWNLACDITVENIIDGLYLKCVHQPASMVKRQALKLILEEGKVMTAQRIYRRLQTLHLPENKMQELRREFIQDDHGKWYENHPNSPQMSQRKKNWDDIRNRMQTEMETFSKEAGEGGETLVDQLRAQNQNRYDYKEFLRKFSVLKEEMKVDMDTFDYIFYNYGMNLYGNMPLIEPLETKEERKVEDFVIVIDTSMSCKGELVQKFLEETYSVLSESESFFRRIHVHILQCDEKIQSDVVIENAMQLNEYMSHFTVKGGGGTDFRPAFAYVEQLMRAKKFTKLRGLIYFTDGYGIYPAKMPPYETAFVFMKEDYQDIDVPPWAIRLILDEEDLESV